MPMKKCSGDDRSIYEPDTDPLKILHRFSVETGAFSPVSASGPLPRRCVLPNRPMNLMVACRARRLSARRWASIIWGRRHDQRSL
jgi:hypothetical protein